MQLKSFVLPVMDSDAAEEDLNKFLRGHRVMQANRQFCPDRGGYWAVLVEYSQVTGKAGLDINNREIPAIRIVNVGGREYL